MTKLAIYVSVLLLLWLPPLARAQSEKFSKLLKGQSTFGPTIGLIVPGSGVAGGVRFKYSLFQGSAAASIRGYQQYDFQFGINKPRRSLFLRILRYEDVYDTASVEENSGSNRGPILYLDFRYRKLPQEDFFGIGPGSQGDNKTDFLQRDIAITGVGGYQWNPHLRLIGRGGLMRYNLGRGKDSGVPNTEQIFDDFSAPGLNEEPDFFLANAAFMADYRDLPDNAHHGWSIGLGISRFELESRAFGFIRYSFDARRHWTLFFSESHVTAFRLWSSFDDPGLSNRIPFYVLLTLGGNSALHGIPSYRFRDQKIDLWFGRIPV